MFTFVAGFSSWPTWFATEGELASVLSPTKLSSGGGLGGNLEVSNFSNTVASDMGVFPPDCPGEDKFSTPVLSEMLSEETFIRREILTLGALINQKHQSVKKSLYYKAELASSQGEANSAFWLLPERARWAHLANSGLPALVPQAKLYFWPYNNFFILLRSKWLSYITIPKILRMTTDYGHTF